MRLGEFLASSSARVAPVKSVKFKILGKSIADGTPLVAEAEATLVFVDEQGRQEAKRDAREELRKLYTQGAPSTEGDFAEELTYQFLHRALRDSSDPQYRVSFAESVLALRKALTYKTAQELDLAYNEWIEQEFPDTISEAQLATLKEEAKKKSLTDLLSAYGFSQIRRVLPFLAATSGQ